MMTNNSISWLLAVYVTLFGVCCQSFNWKSPSVIKRRQQQTVLFALPRYGPPSSSPASSSSSEKATSDVQQRIESVKKELLSSEENNNDTEFRDLEQEEWERLDAIRVKRQRLEFRNLIDQILRIEKMEHIPGLMSKHVELLLSMRGYEVSNVVEELIKETKLDGDDEDVALVRKAIEFVTEFIQEFVIQTQQMDDTYKHLLGKIIRTMRDNSGNDKYGSSYYLDKSEQEELLDALIEKERSNFTPGFLRHLEGECKRIRNAQQMTPESTRLLETLCIIQTRVLEELGKEMSEGTQLLGQLMGYESNDEMIGVLDAALTVRCGGGNKNLEFAIELQSLAEEALRGFEGVHNVEPGLIRRMELIQTHMTTYIAKQQNLLRP